MNWRKLFPVGDVLTAGDKKELEKLEQDCSELRKAEQKILNEWPKDSGDRDGRLRELADGYAKNPTAEIYNRLTTLAGFPAHPMVSFQTREIVLGAIHRAIAEKMEPEIPIVRRVLLRALDATERELEKQTAREKKEAEEGGFPYSPTGRVLELQKRVLDLRNRIADKYPSEGNLNHPGHWQTRLAEWL